MDLASLIAAQQLLSSANSGLTAAQQQQLIASITSSMSQLSTAQQHQLLASMMGSSGAMSGMTGMTGSSGSSSGHSSSVSGLTPAQQQLLAAAGTSLTSVGGGRKQDQFSSSRSSTPSTPRNNDLSLTRPPLHLLCLSFLQPMVLWIPPVKPNISNCSQSLRKCPKISGPVMLDLSPVRRD